MPTNGPTGTIVKGETMTRDDIIDQLNEYERAHPDHSDIDNPHNIWEDVIYQLDTYDDYETRRLDPNSHSDIIALIDGNVIVFVPGLGAWT